ncbi:MAG UNVERIFIED_CONTAM: sulfatase-like hydrolase/transferase [Planctomycetaceae bacterium]
MTGRYATRTGVYTIVRPNAKWGLPLEERTLADALRQAGYTTAITGKWHLGEFEPAYTPTARGFDHQYGHYFGAIDYYTHIRDGKSDWYRDDKPLSEDGYSTELIAAEASRLITQHKSVAASKPLFLYVPFNGVHAPLQVPESYLQPYSALRGNRRTYAGMLAAVDAAIGRITAALKDSGMLDNTLVLFTADNGGPSPGTVTSNGILRAGKGTIYEGGVRGCAFVRWPGKIPAAARSEEPVHAVDWFPTLVGIAGGTLEQPKPLDGKDLVPMLVDGKPNPHDSILLVQSPSVPLSALVTGNCCSPAVRTPPTETGKRQKRTAINPPNRKQSRQTPPQIRQPTAAPSSITSAKIPAKKITSPAHSPKSSHASANSSINGCKMQCPQETRSNHERPGRLFQAWH